MLNNLSLESPHGRRMAQGHPMQVFSPLGHEEEDRFSDWQPDPKRRRFDRVPAGYVTTVRAAPPRQSNGPATPFPFGQHSQITQPRPFVPGQGTVQLRKPSLPHATELVRTVHGQSNYPTTMAPPPRPGMGYSQHRTSYGHVRAHGQDLSLTLPPLQTNTSASHPEIQSAGSALASAGLVTPFGRDVDKRSAAQIIMDVPFMHKIHTLRSLATPLPLKVGNGSRGAIVAVEGDGPGVAADDLGELGVVAHGGRDDDLAALVVVGDDRRHGVTHHLHVVA